ncbi:MAG: tetratricopeptide repeat protein, partial [Planctomycetota bacterium]
ADRYQHVEQMAQDIDAFLGTRSGIAWKDGLPMRVAKWARRNPGWAMGSGVATICVLMVALVLVFALRAMESAHLATAESERQRTESDRQREESERQRELAEQQARIAEYEHLAREGQLAELAERLGGKVQVAGQRARDEFQKAWADARRRGESDQQFVDSLGGERIQEYIHEITAVVESSEQLGRTLHTAEDLHCIGLLYTMGLGQHDEALRWYDRAIRMDPGLRAAWLNKANCLRILGRRDQQLATLNEYLADHGGDWSALFQRGNAYMDNGDNEMAIADYSSVVRLKPDHAEAWVNRASLRFKARDFHGALQDATRATEANPNLWQAWANLAGAQSNTGSPDRAVESMIRAWRLCPDRDTRRALAGEVRKLGGTVPPE